MKILKLSEEKALKLYKTGSNELKEILEESFGKETFNRDITTIVYDLDSLAEYLNLSDIEDLYIIKKPKTDFDRYINACNVIPKIVSVYNEDIILDWNNTSIYKYLPCFKKVSSGWVFYYSSGSWSAFTSGSVAHYFKSSLLSDKAINNFNKIYLDFYSYKG